MSTAQKYRKKPVEIEAMQWDGTVTEGQEIMHWAAKASGMAVPPEYLNDTPRGPVGIHTPRGLDPYLSIITLEGTMTARPGDFIIRGVQGEFYPCKPDIFEQTYEEALTPTDDEREALSEFLFTVYEHGTQPNALREADAILSFLRSRRSGLELTQEITDRYYNALISEEEA